MKLIILLTTLLLTGCSLFRNPKGIKIGMEVTNGYCVGHVIGVYPNLNQASLIDVNCQGFNSSGPLDFPLDDVKERGTDDKSDDHSQ